jgi:hypothetical protein
MVLHKRPFFDDPKIDLSGFPVIFHGSGIQGSARWRNRKCQMGKQESAKLGNGEMVIA